MSRRLGRPVRRGDADDRGLATVLVLALCLVLLLVGTTATSLAGIAVARARAASAADLSALAAAGAALDGPVTACRRASSVAAQVGAHLARCRLQGEVADVVAEVRPPGPLGRFGTAAVRARAGPERERGSARRP